MKYAMKWSDGEYKYFDSHKEAEEYRDRIDGSYRRCDEYFHPVLLSEISPVEDEDICEKCHTPTVRHITDDVSQCEECHTVFIKESIVEDEPVKSHWYDAF
jgi:hypothetical protein